MRYYVVTIQYNKEKQAENRTAPKAFDTLEEAKREYHVQMGKDMGNTTLGWSLCMVFNDIGYVYPGYCEKWIAPEV